tara:strand:+ start:91 stop:321 length:231 start_codon:yes stop_codon:yes gene_type:complete
MQGFNELVSITDIKAGDELTIDYGTVSVGEGNIIIDNCSCSSKYCRNAIKTDDYKTLPKELLAAYPRYMRDNNVDD